jgi:hypothetical protein
MWADGVSAQLLDRLRFWFFRPAVQRVPFSYRERYRGLTADQMADGSWQMAEVGSAQLAGVICRPPAADSCGTAICQLPTPANCHLRTAI